MLDDILRRMQAHQQKKMPMLRRPSSSERGLAGGGPWVAEPRSR
jgi:hypothetical protein